MVASRVAGSILPRLKNRCVPEYTHGMSVGSALAFFAPVGSGMIALTESVFAIAFALHQ
jgi:hypothetical protein